MKTFEEALQTIYIARPAGEINESNVLEISKPLLESERKYEGIRDEAMQSEAAQNLLRVAFDATNGDACTALNVAFYFGLRVGMEMEKQESLSEERV